MDSFWDVYAWRCASAPLDVAAMRAAAEALRGDVRLGAFVKRERHRHLRAGICCAARAHTRIHTHTQARALQSGLLRAHAYLTQGGSHTHARSHTHTGAGEVPAYETHVSDVCVYAAESLPGVVVVELEASRFFYSTVRLLVWELARVGRGQSSAADFAALVAAGAAGRAEVTSAAPAHALCLLRVCYDAPHDPFGGEELGTDFPLFAQGPLEGFCA